MSGNSSVGNSQVYEAGDQRNYKDSELNQKDPYHEGKENSHNNLDSSTIYTSRGTKTLQANMNRRGRALDRKPPCR